MHDLLLRGGSVHDGTGAPAVTADVAVAGDRIVAVGRDLGPARRVVDVDGLAVAPGFVDAHTHSDLVALTGRPEGAKLRQGVTTEVVGNCGVSFAPLDEAAAGHLTGIYGDLTCGLPIGPRTFAGYLAEVDAARPTTNVVALVGHAALRTTANGMAEALAPGALDRMCALLAESLDAGAAGLSSGLVYPPGSHAAPEEMTALAAVAQRYGRIYATHLRDEGDRLPQALDEAIAVAEASGVRLQVSHCKVTGRRNHGRAPDLLARLHAARRAGIDVAGDAYPYTSGATVMVALLPPSATAGGADRLVQLLGDPRERERLRAAADHGQGLWRAADPGGVRLMRHKDPGVCGRTLAEVGADPWTTLCELVAADPGATVLLEAMDLTDVLTILADPLIGIGSDGTPSAGAGHPRNRGCFPELFATVVRTHGALDLPTAVHKATAANADRFGLAGRGRLGAGAVADVCVFDPARVAHPDPLGEPAGFLHVLVAGVPAVEDGRVTGARAGRVLRA
jgi:N-acyl-D-aspartate/D-glutamate deacylase